MSDLVASIAVLITALDAGKTVQLAPALQKYVEARTAEFDQIPQERKERLNEIATYVRSRVKSNQPALLTFICTHNSRRSHLAQIWAKTAATYHGFPGVATFSGGTAATALNSRAISALQRAGFSISTSQPPAADNPRYQVRFHDNAEPMVCFSKVYDQQPNPTHDFCALMTCSEADKSCPVVPGASLRIALPYDDPKAFDNTPNEADIYDQRSQHIAREMLYIFSKV